MATIQEHLEYQNQDAGRGISPDPETLVDQFTEGTSDRLTALSRRIGSRFTSAAGDVTSFAKSNPWPVALGLVSIGAGLLLASGAVSASSLVPKRAMEKMMPSMTTKKSGRNSAVKKARKKKTR